jgi:uncharacterized 2Fe-2S/4Fe-4S cluster protein (DUF4445 family)
MMMTRVAPHGRRSLLALLLRQGIVVRADCGGHGMCGKCRVRVRDSLGLRYVLACRFVPEEVVRVEPGPPRPGRRQRPVSCRVDPDLNLAVDFGTTTISMAAVDTVRRRVRSTGSVLNPQVVFGADVMTRISRSRQVRRVRALEPVLDPAGLGAYPYRSRVPLRRTVSGRTASQPSLRVRVPPLLGSFVGADCTAAILASGIHRGAGPSLLVDAGTNGEVVLGNRESILACSTAAGPAFEGATLECGSLARPGAIAEVRPGRDGFQVRTVGGGPAASICGSGVLSALGAALRNRRLRPDGRIRRGDRLVLVGEGTTEVYLSQADIREVQLAKAAIAAGIRALLAAWPARAEDIGRIHLTGKFGAAIDPADAFRIGLLPEIPGTRVIRHPNLALRGAVMVARDQDRIKEAEAFAGQCHEIVLSGHPGFESEFIEALELKPWQ